MRRLNDLGTQPVRSQPKGCDRSGNIVYLRTWVPEMTSRPYQSIEYRKQLDRDEFLEILVLALYQRNDFDIKAGRFGVRGCGRCFPCLLRKFSGQCRVEIENLREIDHITGETIQSFENFRIYPANQYVTTRDKIEVASKSIEKELDERVAWFEKKNLLKTQRIRMRAEYDLEMPAKLASVMA